MADEGHRLGGHADPIDHRDFSHFSHEEAQTLLSKTSTASAESSDPFILPDLPPVYSQLKIGSCTANAVAAALRYAYKKSTGTRYEDYNPSRLWIYYQARLLANIPGFSDDQKSENPDISVLIRKDTGSYVRAAIKSLLDVGVCDEGLWPYGTPSSDPETDIFLNIDKPPNPCEPVDFAKATSQAKNLNFGIADAPGASVSDPMMKERGVRFSRIFDIAAKAGVQMHATLPDSEWQMIYNQPAVALLEQCLRGGYPFVFGIQLFRGARLNAIELDQHGVLGKPPTEAPSKFGKHTMIAVGFDTARRLFLVQNSWGEKWPTSYVGKDASQLQGRCWMPYEWFEAVVEDQPITYDFWVIRYN